MIAVGKQWIDFLELSLKPQKDENVGTGLVGAPACGDVMVCPSFLIRFLYFLFVVQCSLLIVHCCCINDVAHCELDRISNEEIPIQSG